MAPRRQITPPGWGGERKQRWGGGPAANGRKKKNQKGGGEGKKFRQAISFGVDRRVPQARGYGFVL